VTGVVRPHRNRVREQAAPRAPAHRQGISQGPEAMSRTNRGDRTALDRLADALVEDILSASDAELLSEVRRGDVAGAAAARAAFNRAAARLGKGALAPAKAGTRGWWLPRNLRTLDPKAARLRLDEFMAQYPEAARRLSVDAEDLSDEQVYGLLERLQRQGALSRGDEHGGR